jgi:membrane-associated protease RseP (regulator of RpoE activity)
LQEPKTPITWKLNALLFFLTVLTTFSAGASQNEAFMRSLIGGPIDPGWVGLFPWLAFALTDPLRVFSEGFAYAGTFLTILLFHEFGHYIFARKHNVDASLPYFIPMPLMFIGTMGAVIRMRGRIQDRDALLDIGAGGPLGGLLVAIPLMVIGVSLSEVKPLPVDGYLQEGNTLLYAFIKYLFHGEIPAGSDVMLHPMAFGAWFGFFMTALNLLPIGQLDGGHITFAWLPRYHPFLSKLFHGLLFAVPVALYFFVGLAGLNWLVFAAVIYKLMGSFGPEHPPVESDAPLSTGRKWVAALSMFFFVVLVALIPLREVEPQAPPSATQSSASASQPSK